MQQVVAGSTARDNFNTLLLTVFAGIALLLASVGIYGLMAYSVEQRKQEIGIRMALGAGREQVLRMIVTQTVILTAVGIAIGVAASYGLTRLLSTLLFGVTANDPLTYSFVAAGLAVVSLAAAAVPARRATQVDPVDALRHE